MGKTRSMRAFLVVAAVLVALVVADEALDVQALSETTNAPSAAAKDANVLPSDPANVNLATTHKKTLVAMAQKQAMMLALCRRSEDMMQKTCRNKPQGAFSDQAD